MRNHDLLLRVTDLLWSSLNQIQTTSAQFGPLGGGPGEPPGMGGQDDRRKKAEFTALPKIPRKAMAK